MSTVIVNSTISTNGKFYHFSVSYNGGTFRFKKPANKGYTAIDVLAMLETKALVKDYWSEVKVGNNNKAKISPLKNSNPKQKRLYYWQEV